MRWLLHGNLTPAVKDALVRHEHTAVTPPEIGLAPDAPADEIFKTAHSKQLDLITADPVLANHLFEHPLRYARSLVFLQLDGRDVEQDDAVDRLFERYKRLTPGRLYTVTATRVKVRQLPGH